MSKIFKVNPINIPLNGSIEIPSDKSISHRAAMIGALTNHTVQISNYSQGADCKSTLKILQSLGVEIEYKSENTVFLNAQNGLKESKNIMNMGNSGTTTRFMTGILAGQNFYSVIAGDESLTKRPMARVIKPLKLMGAQIWARDSDTKLPISVKGSELNAISYQSPIASAQVKSALLLAGLFANGETVIEEPFKSRDHTERILSYLDANIKINNNIVSIEKSALAPKPISVPGDISSAAFFMVAASVIKDSDIILKNVGLNSTRIGIIDVLKQMGADITILDNKFECGEEVGDIQVKYANLKGVKITQDLIPSIIDEIPIIAVAATQAEGATIIEGAEDLRYKESDRIAAICSGLVKMGVELEEKPDGFIVQGANKLKGDCTLETYHDHRIAMSAYIAGLLANKPIGINGFEWVNISFPEFLDKFEQLTN